MDDPKEPEQLELFPEPEPEVKDIKVLDEDDGYHDQNMSTGYILGLGLSSIVVVFYIMLNWTEWLQRTQTKRQKMFKIIKKFHDPNYVIITPVVLLYGYGACIFIRDLIG